MDVTRLVLRVKWANFSPPNSPHQPTMMCRTKAPVDDALRFGCRCCAAVAFLFFLLIGTFSYAFRLPRVVAYTVRPSDGFGIRKAKLWTVKHIFLPFQNSDRYSRGVQSPYRSSNREARGHKVTQQKNTTTVTRWNVGGG